MLIGKIPFMMNVDDLPEISINDIKEMIFNAPLMPLKKNNNFKDLTQ